MIKIIFIHKSQLTIKSTLDKKTKKYCFKFYAKTLSVHLFVNVVHTNINSMGNGVWILSVVKGSSEILLKIMLYDFSVWKKLKHSCIAEMSFLYVSCLFILILMCTMCVRAWVCACVTQFSLWLAFHVHVTHHAYALFAYVMRHAYAQCVFPCMH